MNIQLYTGDCLEVMQTLDENSVDTIITDPPYGLSFMGKDWDYGVPGKRYWVEALRVAKPGAMLLAFGGTRTHHRLMCAIEDAGWQIRDAIFWVYGSGFPKSHNIGKATQDSQWDGYGTALKPAYEIIVLAMKPLDGTFANNALTWGVAGLNIDGGRVAHDEPTKYTERDNEMWLGARRNTNTLASPAPSGRWPANLIHDGSEEVTALFPVTKSTPGGMTKFGGVFGNNGEVKSNAIYTDEGSAARFFYCAKASRKERNAGLPDGESSSHPTVKPLALMRYLCKLTATPTGGTVLDMFAGSGSTGCAAVLEGRDFIGIDLDADYVEIARRRIAHCEAEAEPAQLVLETVQ